MLLRCCAAQERGGPPAVGAAGAFEFIDFFPGLGEAGEEVARAVFQVLARHVTDGEIEGVKHGLPMELCSLWP